MSDYKLVPVEPVHRMLNAPLQGGRFENRLDLRPSIYRTMLAEAPAINIVATKNEQGQIVSVTLQDEDHRILEAIAEADVQQPTEQQPEVLAKGYFHPLPDENDYEFHAEENFPDGNDCPECVPAVIVRKSAVAIQPAPDTLIGRTVSLDVSTGEHDAFHRLFGTVIGVEGQDGVILCELDDDNEDKQTAPDVAALVEALSESLKGIEIPSVLTPARAEFFKAGVHAAVNRLNTVLAAHRKQGGEV